MPLMPALVPPACADVICNEGCNLACERHATWRPVAGAALLPTMSDNGKIFRVDATGGGRLFFPRLDEGRPVVVDVMPVVGRKGPRVTAVKGPKYQGR